MRLVWLGSKLRAPERPARILLAQVTSSDMFYLNSLGTNCKMTWSCANPGVGADIRVTLDRPFAADNKDKTAGIYVSSDLPSPLVYFFTAQFVKSVVPLDVCVSAHPGKRSGSNSYP